MLYITPHLFLLKGIPMFLLPSEHHSPSNSAINIFFKEKAKQFCRVIGHTPVPSHTLEELVSSVRRRHLQRDKDTSGPHSALRP